MPLTAYANTFSGNPLDRAGDRRVDPAWLAAHMASPDALAVAVWNGRPLVETGGDAGARLAYLRADLVSEAAGGDERMVFLGLWKNAPVFAAEFEGPADPAEGPLRGLGRFEELRGLALTLPAHEAAIAATAKSLLEWHRRHGFCAACGQKSDIVDGGWKRLCPACKAEHFPRVDPVVIMLPVLGDRCLMGRQSAWPHGRMSALAGFVEPGESIEEACARELKEEAGLICTRAAYHSSQPWPFPSTLMIGLIAEVENDHATPDQTELEEVRWFTRDELRIMLERGEFDGIHPPPPLAIAHHLLKAWVGGFGG
ncbi:NAD(+) diphosphatase [Caulobacter sp. 17J80-11]|uniref:NAD(+) diphosphatase n=1 Tax=Caulobacter sp. 17J80-11 TaxID=2763502 RepID=UPI001653EE5E|nr:NAD(+) diphosphatase [Caulobacter sp. 17J80-11]MBC6981656.1 NAD(+) diphosphatase [Caulobacter sp. 17J80-11]